MIAAERAHVEKSRTYHELEIRHKQLQFLLDRLNSYNTQATLVTGFAFTAFSADALSELPYEESPVRSFIFAFFSALAMAVAVGCVGVSSYLMWRAERLAMLDDVKAAVASVRQGIPVIATMYAVSLVGLFGAACGLLFAMCHSHKIGSCDVVGYMVVIVFFIVIALCIGLSLAISRQFDRIERAPMTTQLLRDADAAGNFNDTSNQTARNHSRALCARQLCEKHSYFFYSRNVLQPDRNAAAVLCGSSDPPYIRSNASLESSR